MSLAAAHRPARAGRSVQVLLLGAAGFLALLGLWWGSVLLFHPRTLILPSPRQVADQLSQLWNNGLLTKDLATSLEEFASGFAIGVASGVSVGVLMSRSRVLMGFFSPLVELFRVVIPFSLVPLAVVWFGLSMTGKVFIVWYACFFVIVVNTLNGIQNVDPLILKAGRMLGWQGRALALRAVVPAALPRIFAGIQLAVAYGWVSVIAAEYIGSSSGLGYLITNAQQSLATSTVMAGMVVIGVVGVVLSTLTSLMERTFIPYRTRSGW